MYQNFIIPWLYEAQHVSGDTPPIIRSLKLHWQPPVLHTWKVVGRSQARCAWLCPPTTHPTTFHILHGRLLDVVRHVVPDYVHQLHIQQPSTWRTGGCQCSFRLLMMGGVSPETCCTSYKHGIIKCWYIVASIGFFFMNYIFHQYTI